MHRYTRFALSCTPAPDSDLAALGKHWLGWDIDNGKSAAFLKIENLPRPALALTARVRRFGFQAFLMAPFRLARGHSPLDLHHTAQAVASRFAPISMPGLRMTSWGNRLSLTPFGQHGGELSRYCETVFRVFENFPAPVPEKRDETGLTDDQWRHLDHGTDQESRDEIPMQFRISDVLPERELTVLSRVLRPILEPNLPRPFVIGCLSLVGEDDAGCFHLIQRYPLTGHATVKNTPSDIPAQRVRMPLHW